MVTIRLTLVKLKLSTVSIWKILERYEDVVQGGVFWLSQELLKSDDKPAKIPDSI
jgi:hypothetical protein